MKNAILTFPEFRTAGYAVRMSDRARLAAEPAVVVSDCVYPTVLRNDIGGTESDLSRWLTPPMRRSEARALRTRLRRAAQKTLDLPDVEVVLLHDRFTVLEVV